MARRRRRTVKKVQVAPQREAFKRKLLQERLWQTAGVLTITILAVLTVLILTGVYEPNLLQKLGITFKNQGTGLWVDCSRVENKRNPYCLSRNEQNSKTNQDWQALGKKGASKAPAFDLP